MTGEVPGTTLELLSRVADRVAELEAELKALQEEGPSLVPTTRGVAPLNEYEHLSPFGHDPLNTGVDDGPVINLSYRTAEAGRAAVEILEGWLTKAYYTGRARHRLLRGTAPEVGGFVFATDPESGELRFLRHVRETTAFGKPLEWRRVRVSEYAALAGVLPELLGVIEQKLLCEHGITPRTVEDLYGILEGYRQRLDVTQYAKD